MNETPNLSSRLLLPLLMLAAACSPAAREAPPLEGASIGGPFTLTGHDGRQVKESDFAGQYRLIYFGFTHCPDVCPTDLQQLALGLRRFEQSDPARARQVQPIFVTVDPERDTPEVMRQFVSAFHPRLIGLTGSQAQIADVARRYGVAFSNTHAAGARDYPVDHSRILLLFGRQGEPLAIVPHDEGAEAVAGALERWAL